MKRRVPPIVTDTAGYRSRRRPGKRKGFLPKAITLAVASCFAAEVAIANPNGFAVVNGQVVFNYNGNTLTVTNTPGSIINWQSFSIAQNEITRFIQQSAASSVLNRVIGIDPSIILGALQSNGRVFLINPNGILFGAGAQIDVAGLVASTLNLSNGDFLAGRLRFTDTPGAGSINNQGAITTPSGGQVYLIAPNVQNTGIITSPQGEIILAAGRSVELVDAGTPGLRVEITAPDTEALNVGQIVANSGKVGIYAGLIRNSGIIKADGVVVGQNGEILLKATQNTTLDAGSIVSASGAQGGNVTIQSGDTTLVSGTVEAKGSEGQGGIVKVLGDRVGLIDHANINASGETGGGTVLVGGDYQGRNPDIQNARQSLVGANASINADAITSGNGGKVIVWGNDSTQFYGAITARGGAQSGNGGFVETSGHWLDFSGTVNTLAPHGAAGTLLLDPHNIIVAIAGLATLAQVDQFADTPGADSTIAPATINAAASNVVLQANNDVTFTDPVNIATSGVGLTAQAGRSILVNANITTNSADVRLTANETVGNGVSGANRDAGAATLSMAPGTTINAGPTGNIYLRMNDGSGHAGTSGNIVVENLNADNVSIIHDGLTANSSILRASGSSLLSANAVFMELENAAGASASIGTSVAPIRVSTPILEAHYHNASGGIFIDSPNPEDLQIGGVPGLIFSGLVRGVQTVSGGPISITVNGNLSQLAGSAGCGLTGGTGGPICAGGGGSLALAVTGSDINLNSFVNAGTATLTATGDINVLNATVTTTGAMDVNAAGNLNVTASTAATFLQSGGLQSIDANGITVQGAASGSNLVAGITGNGGQNITVGSGGITVIGGALGTNNGAFIQQFGALNDQTITVNGGGTVSLTGGGGTQNYAQISNQGHAQAVNFTAGGALNLQGGSGANQNEAGIQNQGAGATTQTISFTGGGAINLTGGTVGQNNRAEIHAFTGNQTISGNPDITMIGGASGGAFDNENGANISLETGATGVQTINAHNISLTGGAGGSNNMAVISTETTGQTSNITTTGFVTLTGGAGTDALAAIGDNKSDTNITLNATGPVTLIGGGGGFSNYGAFAAIGAINGYSATVTVNSGGDVTLNSGWGPGAFAGIGSVGGGGTVNVSAGGNLALTGTAINPASIVSTGDITLSATNDITVRQNGLVIAGGDIMVSGVNFNVGSAGATKNTTVTAGGDFTANLTGTLSVLGGNATFSCCDAVRDASAKLHANGIVDVTAARVNVAAGAARADGGEGATSARADAELSAGGNMFLNVGALGVNIAAGSAQVFAGPGENLTANANATLSAGGNLTMNIGPVAGTALFIGGGIAGATAQSGGGAVATAHADTTVSAGSGKDLEITVYGGDITIGAGNATALAFHLTSYSSSAVRSGNNKATASTNVNLSAGNNATITMSGGTLTVGGGYALASAYKQSRGSGSWYGSNTLSGTNDATAEANLTVKATSGNLTVNLGGAAMGVGSNLASAYAFHEVLGGGSNTLRDNNTATATADILFTAGNKLAITDASILAVGAADASPSFFVQRPFARASAYKYVTGWNSGNNLSGVNQATANANTTFSAAGAGGLNITVGELRVGGGSASAFAYHSANSGNMHTLSGNNTATSKSNVSFTASAPTGSLQICVGSIGEGGGCNSSATGGAMVVQGWHSFGSPITARAFKRVSGGGSSHVMTTGDNSATAQGELTFSAGAALTITAGSLSVAGNSTSAKAYKEVIGSSEVAASNNKLSGNNTAAANSNISLTGGSITLDLGSGSLSLNGNSASAYARHTVEYGNNNNLGGDHVATANSNITLTATGGALTVNAAGGVSIYGDNASAHATKRVGDSSGASGNTNTLSGMNTATANSNISLSGTSLTLNLGSDSLYISASYAKAKARHRVFNGDGNTLSGNNDATANSNITLAATSGALEINANGGVNIYGSDATASAYKTVNSGNTNTLSGNNTATANQNISLSGASLTLNLGGGSLTVAADDGDVYAFHEVYGNGNNLSGNHSATGNSNITLAATGGALTVNATGGVTLSRDDGEAYAYKYVSGSNNTISDNNSDKNTALQNNSVSLSGTSVALNLDTGSLSLTGSSAIAKAYSSVYGNSNTLGGTHSATVNSSITLTATGGALTVNSALAPGNGSVNINAGGNSTGAIAKAYKYVSGNNNTISGDNTATVDAKISLSGASVGLYLGAGSLNIGVGGSSGSYASARAYHKISGGSGNILRDNHIATANNNISLTATGGALTVNATGGVTINGSSASARAYKYVSGGTAIAPNTLSGNNTATANSNISLTGTSLTLELGTGTLNLNGSSASARAYHQVSGDSNVLSGLHNATANSNIILSATGGDLTINAGNVNINGSSASARAYMTVSGNNNTVGIAGTASNTATADSTIKLTAPGGNLTINVGSGGVAASASISASAYAYHQVNGGFGNKLNGDNTANATNGVLVQAGGTLEIQAGSLSVGYNDASASAYKSVCCFGADNNQLTGNNFATGNGLIKFSAGTLNLGTLLAPLGSLNVFGSYTSARAYNSISSGNNNTLSGSNTAKALAPISFSAGALTIQANSVSIAASSASARASNNIAGTGNTVNGLNSALAQSNVDLSGGALTIQANSLSIAAYSASAVASHNVAGTGNTVNAANDALAQSNVNLSGSTLTIQAPSLSVIASSGRARAYRTVSGSGNAVNGANTARAEGNLFLSGNTNVTIDVGAGNILVQGGNANAFASSSIAAGNTVSGANTAIAHGNALIASGGDLAIAARDPVTLLLTLPGASNLTIQGGNASANTSGSGMNVANANANAAIFAVGAKTINVTGTVALSGGSVAGSGTPSAFAMLDPGSLDLTAFDLSLTPNGGGVVLSAFGGINLTLVALGGVPVPLDTFFGGLPPPLGVVAGESTLTSVNPIIVSVGGGSLNLTDLFGLPSGFLGLTLPSSEIIDPCSVAPEICAPLKFSTAKRDDVLDTDKDKDKDKGKEKDKQKEEKGLSKGLKAECD